LEHSYIKAKNYLTNIQFVLDNSNNDGLISAVKPLFAQWKKIVKEDENVFTLRIEEMSAADEIDVRIKIYDRNAKWLVAAAHATIGAVQSEIKVSAEKTDAELKRNGIYLILLAILCAFASVILAIRVGRNIGSRIEMLQYSMELHAEGKKGDLPTEGTDEIGRMAAAMKKFINKIDQREYELKKTHSELNLNLSELKSAQLSLLLSEKKFKDFAQVSADLFWEMDAGLYFTLIQGNALSLVGVDAKEVLNKKLRDVVPVDSYSLIEHYFEARMSFEGAEFYWPNKKGKLLRFRISGKALYDEEDDFLGYRGTGSDVTQSHQLSKKLVHQAHHDALTNLANRISFECKLQPLLGQSASDGPSHVVLYLDLDKFKVVNDTCGHLAGDNLLISVSEILLRNVRERDLVARLGGDEFGILLENCSLAKAEDIANKLIQSIADFNFEWENKAFKIGVSIGVALLSTLPQNMMQIIKAADSACYSAKKSGRNRMHVYDPDIKNFENNPSKS
jgi:diguanylate cyclase (GGDEF)-like protein/PAS domain S-box-containing protein